VFSLFDGQDTHSGMDAVNPVIILSAYHRGVKEIYFRYIADVHKTKHEVFSLFDEMHIKYYIVIGNIQHLLVEINRFRSQKKPLKLIRG
jgi:hypothetical protein